MPEAVVFFSFLWDMGVVGVGEVAEAVERKVFQLAFQAGRSIEGVRNQTVITHNK